MMTRDERAELIAMYAAGYDEIVASLVGITDEEWEAREAPGEWSPRDVDRTQASRRGSGSLAVGRLGDGGKMRVARFAREVSSDRQVVRGQLSVVRMPVWPLRLHEAVQQPSGTHWTVEVESRRLSGVGKMRGCAESSTDSRSL